MSDIYHKFVVFSSMAFFLWIRAKEKGIVIMYRKSIVTSESAKLYSKRPAVKRAKIAASAAIMNGWSVGSLFLRSLIREIKAHTMKANQARRVGIPLSAPICRILLWR